MSEPRPRGRRHKPAKPYATFALTAHNNGQWCKKIRGKIFFFGVWGDPQAALDNYLRVAADLHSGRQPRTTTLSSDSLTVKDACNHYLTSQLRKVQNGQILPSTFEDCRCTAKNFARLIGPTRVVSDLAADDFERFRNHISRRGLAGKSKGLGVYAQSRVISIVKSLFKYAYEADLIDKPMKFGTGFKKPSAMQKRKTRRVAELENGKRLFEPHQICAMLEVATEPLRTMILLGINGGFGNTDCGRLVAAAVDLDQGIIEFDRPKTGVERVVPLWPKTTEALREALAKRPKPAEEAAGKLAFLTTRGRPWVRENVHRAQVSDAIEKVVLVDAVGHEFDKVLTKLGLKRKGIGFYTLRHTFRTWADEVRDQHAIHRIMGHTIPGMSGIYVEKIELDRLRTVVEHVREKIFPTENGEPVPDPKSPTAAPSSTATS